MAIAACSVLVSLLAQMASRCKVPMAIALLLYNVKVESKLRFGRWLWGANDAGMPLLDKATATWANQLLGVDTWHSSGVPLGELGCIT